MRSSSNAVRYLGAAGILALGGVCAASIFSRTPQAQGPDPEQLAMLAARVEPMVQTPTLTLSAPPRPRSRPQAAPVAPATHRPKLPIPTAPRSAAPAPTPPPAAPTESAAEASVKQIALMGVTQQGDEIAAWLVDLSTQAREVAEAGGNAFGFEVKEVSAESVVLTRGAEEFTVRLGEKEIPVAAAAPPTATSAQSANAFGGGRGDRGNRGWRNGQGGFTGRSRFSSNSANQSGSFNRGNNNNQRNNRGNRGGFGGGFGGGFPGAFSGGFSGRGNRNAQGFLSPSANPQEARRRGVSFIGDGDPLPQPAQIQNPQTQRRRGTASGPAFGQASGNSRSNNGNRTGGNNRR